MKYPTHILLDFKPSSVSTSSKYWAWNYFYIAEQNKTYFNTLSTPTNFVFNDKKNSNQQIVRDMTKFTLLFTQSQNCFNFSQESKNFFKILTKSNLIKRKINLNKNKENNIRTTYSLKKKYTDLFTTNAIWTYFDINFIRKEKIYTKLKYSRVPQYDIVSGGVAALFAGFLGFLISEKFGFELVDSGDFYILFMYIVFISFFTRLFFKIVNAENLQWSVLSPKWFIFYIINLFYFFLNNLKSVFK